MGGSKTGAAGAVHFRVSQSESNDVRLNHIFIGCETKLLVKVKRKLWLLLKGGERLGKSTRWAILV